LHPNRLDMRFGKIYVLGRIAHWAEFTKAIVETIEYSGENKNQWTWTKNDVKEDGENFLLSSIQTYQLQLYNTENDSLLVNMQEIANTILAIYPNHIESLSNLSITYLLAGDYDAGLIPLLKAEKIDPNDAIVLSNIARAYILKEDKVNAIAYYKKVVVLDDYQTKDYAEEQIRMLESVGD